MHRQRGACAHGSQPVQQSMLTGLRCRASMAWRFPRAQPWGRWTARLRLPAAPHLSQLPGPAGSSTLQLRSCWAWPQKRLKRCCCSASSALAMPALPSMTTSRCAGRSAGVARRGPVVMLSACHPRTCVVLPRACVHVRCRWALDRCVCRPSTTCAPAHCSTAALPTCTWPTSTGAPRWDLAVAATLSMSTTGGLGTRPTTLTCASLGASLPDVLARPSFRPAERAVGGPIGSSLPRRSSLRASSWQH